MRLGWLPWTAAGVAACTAVVAGGLWLWAGEAITIARAIQEGPPPRDGPTDLLPSDDQERVAFAGAGGPVTADLYLPADGAQTEAALVLVAGAARTGKDDPRTIHFARTIANSGFAVLVPDIPSVRTFQLSAADAEPIADAVEYLESRAASLGYRNIGVAAISYAVGPAVIAALRPEMRERIGFVVGIGGYYDVVSALTYSTTGRYRPGPDEPWRTRAPNTYGKWVMVSANAELVRDETDRMLLAAMAARKLKDPDDDVSELVGRLGPEGRAVHALATNDDPERVPALLDDLPEAAQERLAGLDLRARDLSALEARLILVHGRADPMIPHTESERLAAAAPEAALYVIDSMGHVSVGEALFDDGPTLIRAINALLAERGRTVPALASLPSSD